jgi:hypothetical protein
VNAISIRTRHRYDRISVEALNAVAPTEESGETTETIAQLSGTLRRCYRGVARVKRSATRGPRERLPRIPPQSGYLVIYHRAMVRLGSPSLVR